MDRKDYRNLMNQIEPDEGMEHRIIQRLRQRDEHKRSMSGARNRINRLLKAATGLAVIACLGLVVALVLNLEHTTIVTSNNVPEFDQTPSVSNKDSHAVAIPKIELPKESNAQANMIGLIVYKGNIYTQTSTSISPETAKLLKGKQLGRTKAGIDEWSTSSDYTEMASTIGEMDLYAVKGYDSDFRIMSYMQMDGAIFAELYEQLNGITVARGEDLIGKLHLKEHIESAKWQDFNSWNFSEAHFTDIQVDHTLQAFIDSLYEARPVSADALYEAGIYDSLPENQKFIYLKLQDQTEVQLRLFKDGNYVSYANAGVFFQLDPVVFDAFWEQM
ncbi:hypothetical protein ACK8P5_18420 [Paenibacillus sp. EC2-1]|uniref:hypothetical protein n=1 Tax=Paenibacillus sp. EC2-1 TaxID=3388665 RepID=UPI003BEEB3FD